MRIRNLVCAAGLVLCSTAFAADDPSPPTLNLTVSNNVKTVTWGPLAPALEVLRFMSGVNLLSMNNDSTGVLSKTTNGYQWKSTNALSRQFYSVEATPLSSNALLSYNVLNRLAYGPTPDDIERVITGPSPIGPEAYISEQLAPETVSNPIESYTIVYTNSASSALNSNWNIVTVTGFVSSATGPFYMYLRGIGDVYIDAVRLSLLFTNITGCVTNTNNVVTCTTNYVLGPNVLVNGDFEESLTNGWTIGANLTQSASTTDFACAGFSSCRMVSTAAGSTTGSAIQQNIVAGALTNGHRVVLSFAYLPNPNSDLLTMRLSGTGIIGSGAEGDSGGPGWIYATLPGLSSGSRFLYIYLSGAGEAWVDDLKLVAGNVAEAGPNLLQNGDFESPFGSPWFAVGNHSGSTIDNSVARSGSGSLRVVGTGGGSGNQTNGNSVVQTGIPVTNNNIYTLSFWYRPARNQALTVRLSGQPPDQSPDRLPNALTRRLDGLNWGATLSELRSWHCANAVGSPRQLLEVLTQFLENHFVTYHSKTRDFLDGPYNNGDLEDRIATEAEYWEVSQWRQALLNPNCNFYDLLKIHVESPAQIIYLDTVESRGDGSRIANENYARELFELFTMGVDNGYDQNDIVAMSRAWTGWTVRIVRREDRTNPFAPSVNRNGQGDINLMQYGNFPGLGSSAVSNIIGAWSFVFDPAWHGTNRAPILSEWNPSSPAANPVATGPKRYAARLGPPWAGQSYQITIPRRTGTNGIQDGYDVIRSLAANIYTAEYISVKLCRIFIHDDFPSPTTHTNLPEYAYYNYTNPNRTPEAELIRQCIVAWDTPGPDGRKGNIRAVLNTIFASELFRSHGGSLQKVKTPLEFVASAIRAFRSDNGDGTFTAGTGNSSFNTQMGRMGGMSLFNRADPDGYPEDGPAWISAGTLAERLRFVQTLMMASGRGDDAGSATADPVALIRKKLPSAQWYNANEISTYFLRLLYPAEGMGNLVQYHQAAVNFLNTADNGVTIDLLRPSMAAGDYNNRIRGLAAMLMTMQRFQEQ